MVLMVLWPLDLELDLEVLEAQRMCPEGASTGSTGPWETRTAPNSHRVGHQMHHKKRRLQAKMARRLQQAPDAIHRSCLLTACPFWIMTWKSATIRTTERVVAAAVQHRDWAQRVRKGERVSHIMGAGKAKADRGPLCSVGPLFPRPPLSPPRPRHSTSSFSRSTEPTRNQEACCTEMSPCMNLSRNP